VAPNGRGLAAFAQGPLAAACRPAASRRSSWLTPPRQQHPAGFGRGEAGSVTLGRHFYSCKQRPAAQPPREASAANPIRRIGGGSRGRAPGNDCEGPRPGPEYSPRGKLVGEHPAFRSWPDFVFCTEFAPRSLETSCGDVSVGRPDAVPFQFPEHIGAIGIGSPRLRSRNQDSRVLRTASNDALIFKTWGAAGARGVSRAALAWFDRVARGSARQSRLNLGRDVRSPRKMPIRPLLAPPRPAR